MNYAEKELREAMAYLDQARTTEAMLKATLRLLELGEPVEVSFRSVKGTVTMLCPTKTGAKLLDSLLCKVEERVRELEKQEVYWCEEVAHVGKQERLNLALREQPEKSLNDFRAEEQEDERQREYSRPSSTS